MIKLMITLLSFGLYLSASAQCQADFTYSATNGTVDFTNTSTGLGLFSSWDFGDGNSSFQTNPSNTYTATGNYIVCLSIFDSISQCQSMFCDTIFVQADSTGGGCNVTSNAYANANGTIVGTASGAAMYHWIVYDASWMFLYDTNNSNLNYNPGANGMYNVCLTAYDSLQNVCDSTCYSVSVIDSTGGGGSGCNTVSNSYGSGGTIVGTASGAVIYDWIVYDNSWNFLYNTSNQNFNYNPGMNGLYNVCLTTYDSQQNFCDSMCYIVQIQDSTGGSGCLISSSVSVDQNGDVVGTASGASGYDWTVYDDSWTYLYNSSGSNLNYTPSSPGGFNVCLVAYDSLQNECDSLCYYVESDSLAGLSFEEEIVFNVYPNPTQGMVHLEFSNDQISDIVLIDITGSVLLQKSIHESTSDIDLSLYPKGLYFIHALGRKGQRLSTSKVLRQ
ncbi:MAG: hypothetical protein Crog4KO_13200 [Crocinitomicaceae bacterium]